MSTLQTYTLQHFKDNVTNKFFPRRLIISRNIDAFNQAVYDTLKILNKLLFQIRYYEFYISGDYIDLSTVDIDGIEVDKIMNVIPASDYYTLFENFRLFLGRPFFSFNILRRQDDFIDFILSTEFHKQVMNRYKNYSLNYQKFGDKLLLGENFASSGIGKVTILFLPKLKVDTETTEWELYDLEEEFVCKYLEGLVAYREGRAQGEMKVMDMDTNADDLKEDGTKIMEDSYEEFRKMGFTRIGKKF